MAQCMKQLSGNSQAVPRMEALSWKGSELLIIGGVSRGWTKEGQKDQRRHSGLDPMASEGCNNLGSTCFSNCPLSGSGPAGLFSLRVPDSESAIHMDLSGQGPYHTGVFLPRA